MGWTHGKRDRNVVGVIGRLPRFRNQGCAAPGARGKRSRNSCLRYGNRYGDGGKQNQRVRAAVAHDALTAQMSREHNDANVPTLGARVVSEHQIIEVVASFLAGQFAGGRHQHRADKISELDQEPKQTA